ncbi:MAG TPA: DUF368 domain-containing protein [Planctomycetaceae bacterium]|nr:DUF368 domain-containing protein [Planctomycetaceae bacterium]
MNNERSGFTEDVVNLFRGLCMGCADIVPGVSGGTVALILGHYRRLVAAISHIDRDLLKLISQRKIKEAVSYADIRFLVAVAFGMAAGIIALASLMNYLLENQLGYTLAVFTGLILASSIIVFRRLERWRWQLLVFVLLGGVFAWQICVQRPAHVDLTPMSAFLCATVAICAMILPGISGAFVLLLLGVYHPVTELIKGIPKGEFTSGGLLIVAAFLAGCLVGLLTFSRILKWLLEKYHDRTLAVLIGLMLGSLYKIWPFQIATPESSELPFKEKTFEHVAIGATPDSVAIVAICALAAFAGTFALERIGHSISGDDTEQTQG